jgi:hypothetical protein
MNIVQTAERVNAALVSDSGLSIPVALIERALTTDMAHVRRLPTEKEIDLLVMGDGENGEVPERLKNLFPRLDALLASQF